MFRDTKGFSSFSVDDLGRARDFYGGTLRLDVATEEGMPFLRLAGGGVVLLYPKDDHEPASFTVLNFPVDDIEAAVDRLTDAGVRFEQYEGELQTDAKGIFRDQGPPIAWFRDPAGNVLSVIESHEPGTSSG
jgi:catechol 2,3-dioxygenase-like lactoylglutathione lyase family enzyme